jgi:peptide deformylase
MILTVLQDPTPILREKSQPIQKITADIKKLAEDMLETMYAANGVGLAAPQVGHPVQLIVIDPSAERNLPQVLINPRLESHSKSTIERIEGCLSCRGFEGKVTRYEKVTVQAKNLSGKSVKLKAEGLLARVLQHEIDHLKGILIKDIAVPIPPAEIDEQELMEIQPC